MHYLNEHIPMSLQVYKRKRKFTKTPEPKPRKKRPASKGPLRFVVQKHAATRTHYDFRLELDGTLKSWAVPKGPTLTSGDPRLAVLVEDHPIEYGAFEGVIPKGNYGAGTVMIWDSGTYTERNSAGRIESEKALREGMARGHLTFVLNGKKLRGEFALVKIKKKGAEENAWLLIKKHDAEASRVEITRENRSSSTGRTMEQIAEEAESKGEIWLPRKGRQSKPAPPKPRGTTVAVETPKRIRPMEPIFTTSVPKEPGQKKSGWLFETFGEGVRVIAEKGDGGTRLYSRAGIPLEKKYPTITKQLAAFKRPAVLDAEIVSDKNGARLIVSDLLFLDGKDYRLRPLHERRKVLVGLRFGRGIEVMESVRELARLKVRTGSKVVAKREDSAYRGGLTRDWLQFRTRGSLGRPSPSIETPPLTHLDKVFWPEEGYTKGDLIRYYEKVADVLLPHLVDRPQSLHRQPDGIRSEGFFHKDMTSFLPRRVQTERVVSGSSGRTINYALCQDRWSLLYLVNLGCIEFNPWLSRRQNLERPDFVVIDLDPDENDFSDVVKVARAVHRVLKSVGAESFCKTSGSTGLHICVPTGGRFPYETGRAFAEAVCRIIYEEFPALTSVERNPAKRRRRIYLDFMQNRRAQTLAAPYCVRPRPQATVSAPLRWTELKPSLRPQDFTIENMPGRIRKVGDLWGEMLKVSVDIERCMKELLRRYRI